MRKTLIRATRIAALAAATFAAIGAHAETDTLIDSAVPVPSFLQSIDFTFSGSSATFIEGAAVFDSVEEGVASLSGPDGYYKKFATTDGVLGVDQFTTIVLTQPGLYKFSYDFANSDSTYGGVAVISATVTAATVTTVPEPETLAMLLTGLLAVGVIARRTLRKSDSIGDAVAA